MVAGLLSMLNASKDHFLSNLKFMITNLFFFYQIVDVMVKGHVLIVLNGIKNVFTLLESVLDQVATQVVEEKVEQNQKLLHQRQQQ